MTTSAELTNFWEHFSQTALNKDRGLGVHSTLALSPSSTSKRSSKSSNLPTETSSFVAVPSKRNFAPPSAPSTKASSSSKKDGGGGIKLSTVSKFVASFGRGVASTTGAAVTNINAALQMQQHAALNLGQHHGDNASLLAPSSTGPIMSATGQQHGLAGIPDAFLNQQINNSSQIFPTYSLPKPPRPSDATASKDKSSSTSFLNFRDLLVPHLVSDITTPTGAPPLDLSALVARWPDVLPPDSHWYTMSQLRIHAGAPERSEAGAARLLEYFAVLQWLESRFPLDVMLEHEAGDKCGGEAGVFSWFESLQPNKKVTGSCIQYEKAAVLFNLAAVYSQLAAGQQIWTPDGIKLAAVYFQKAAGVFAHVRDTLAPRFRIKLDKTSDLAEGTLHALCELMLAQAHECFVEKANLDAASSALTSQIAAQTAEHYELALRAAKADLPDKPILGTSSTSGSSSPTSSFTAALLGALPLSSSSSKPSTRIPTDWLSAIHGKSLLYTALAHFHAPNTLGPDAAIGERLARLIIAKTLADRAVAETGTHAPGMTVQVLEYYQAQVGGALHVAEVENQQRYLVAVVDPRHLTALRRLARSCVASTPFVEPPRAGAGAAVGSSNGLALEHAAFATDPSVRVAWKRCVAVLSELVHLAAEGQAAVGVVEELSAQLRAALTAAGAALSGHVGNAGNGNVAVDDTAVLALAHRIDALVAESAILPTVSLTSSLAASIQQSRSVIAKVTAHLDRADATLPRSPTAYAQASHLRSRLAVVTTDLRNIQSVQDRVNATLGLGGELHGFRPEEWTAERVVLLGKAASGMGGSVSARHAGSVEDAIADALANVTTLRDDLSKVLADISCLSLDVSTSGIQATLAVLHSLFTQSSTWIRSRLPDLARRAESILGDAASANATMSAAHDATSTLAQLDHSARIMEETRHALEDAVATALNVQDAANDLSRDAAKVALEVAALEEEELNRARAVASAPTMSEIQRGVVAAPPASVVGTGGVVDKQRHERLMRLQQRLVMQAQPKAGASTNNKLRQAAAAVVGTTGATKDSPPRMANIAVEAIRGAAAEGSAPSSPRKPPRKSPSTSPPLAVRQQAPSRMAPTFDLPTETVGDEFTTGGIDTDATSSCSQSAFPAQPASRATPTRSMSPVQMYHSIPETEQDRGLAMSAARAARAPEIDQWAAEQVALAKQRKKMWKLQQEAALAAVAAANKSKQSRSKKHHHVAAQEGLVAQNHGTTAKKADSGTILPDHSASVVVGELSETVSQMKLKTDAMLANLAVATRPPSATSSGAVRRSGKSRRE